MRKVAPAETVGFHPGSTERYEAGPSVIRVVPVHRAATAP